MAAHVVWGLPRYGLDLPAGVTISVEIYTGGPRVMTAGPAGLMSAPAGVLADWLMEQWEAGAVRRTDGRPDPVTLDHMVEVCGAVAS